jgi:NADH-quinone oxidoreductase subunit M
MNYHGSMLGLSCFVLISFALVMLLPMLTNTGRRHIAIGATAFTCTGIGASFVISYFQYPLRSVEPLAWLLASAGDLPELAVAGALAGLSLVMVLLSQQGHDEGLDHFAIMFYTGATMGFLATDDARVMAGSWLLSYLPAFVGRADDQWQIRFDGLRVFGAYQMVSFLSFVVGIWLLDSSMTTTGQGVNYNFSALMARLVEFDESARWASFFLIIAVFFRQGLFPFQSGVLSLCQKARFSYSVNYLSSQLGFLFLIRVGPSMSHTMLVDYMGGLFIFSTASAIYFALLALKAPESRYAYGSLALMQQSFLLVFFALSPDVGAVATLIGVFSLLLSVAGLGLCLWLFEKRTGMRHLASFQGMAEKMPVLAGFFLVFGLAMVHFPLTVGFISEDLLLHWIMHKLPIVAVVLLVAAAIGGIAVYRFYLRLFGGESPRTFAKRDLLLRESVILAFLLVVLCSLGVLPTPVMKTALSGMAQQETVSIGEKGVGDGQE